MILSWKRISKFSFNRLREGKLVANSCKFLAKEKRSSMFYDKNVEFSVSYKFGWYQVKTSPGILQRNYIWGIVGNRTVPEDCQNKIKKLNELYFHGITTGWKISCNELYPGEFEIINMLIWIPDNKITLTRDKRIIGTFLVVFVTTQSMSADMCHERTLAMSVSPTSARNPIYDKQLRRPIKKLAKYKEYL